MRCPICLGEMWDNRRKKRNPRAPDFKCKNKNCEGVIWPEEKPTEKPESDFAKAKREMTADDGFTETRRHVMRSANLYVLCVKAIEKFCAEQFPEVARTSEMFQAATNTIFIEASSRRTNDGINWWSYVDKMPDHPIK
jgi:hypothetical protein